MTVASRRAMRDMADTTPNNRKNLERVRRMLKLRPWVQALFVLVWVAPIGWLSRHVWKPLAEVQSVPGCGFHCYACPLASFACPVGIVAQFSSAHMFPFLAAGIVLFFAAAVGSLICGWACPFGFLQDLLDKIPVKKFRIPNWMGFGRYLTLIGLVILVPYLWGEAHELFICRVCPAGGIEGGFVRLGMDFFGIDGGVPAEAISLTKWIIVPAFLLLAIFTYRPWCKIFCPLGGFLSLFNRVSVFHLKFDKSSCTQCNTCRARCPMGVKVDKRVNSLGCIRCLECTTCGAITPVIAGLPDKDKAAADKQPS